jgi:hypothetical protein
MWNIGLKEWSATTDAIGRGEQTFLLRKGGIREDGRHFKIEHDQFFLYPGLYHEGEKLLKSERLGLLKSASPDDFKDIVTLSVFAEIEEVIEIASEDEVHALDPFHIWSEDFAVKRFNWKPRHPLNLVIIRGHVLQQPQALMVMPQYSGCKSWVEFIEDYPVGVTTPAIPERKFRSQVDAIKSALSAAGATVK